MPAGPTQFDLTDPATKLVWDSQLMVEVAKRTSIINDKYGFIGDKDTNLIQRKKKLFEEGGTRATVTLVRQLRNDPSYGNEPLRDREEGLRTPTFKWDINQVRHAVAMTGRITPKRVNWSVWETMKSQFGQYWAPRMEAGLLLHGAGINVNVKTAAEPWHNGAHLGSTFCNAPRTPDAAHIYRVHEHATDDLVAADPSAIIDVDTISLLATKARSLPIPIRPAMIHGQELYVLFLHQNQTLQMKKNSRLLAYFRDSLKGGAINGNPIWTGALGIVDGVLIVESNYVPPGIDASNARVANARRGIFCGAQAFTIGLAKEHEDETDFITDTENWDYGNNKGLASAILAGFACPYYDVDEQGTTEDFAKIAVTSYAKELYTSA